MKAGQIKVSKDIERKLKTELGRSQESKDKLAARKKAHYYAKFLNKNL